MKKTKRGIIPLLILAVVGLIAAGGAVLASGIFSKWESYKSEKYGYSLKIPKGWKVSDKSSESGRDTLVEEPEGKASVLITALKDEGLSDLNYMKESIQDFKEDLEKNPKTVKLANFVENVEGNTGGFIAFGEEKRGDKNWVFEYRAILKTDGRVLLFYGVARSDVYKDFIEINRKIMESFRVD